MNFQWRVSRCKSRPPARISACATATKLETLNAEPAAPGDAGQVVDPRVAAMLPAQLLQPGEIIILLLKPSPWYILIEALHTLATLALLFGVALTLVNHGYLALSHSDLLLVTLALAGLRLFWQFLEWLSRVYVLTDRRVLRVRGVLRISVFECSLRRIQHTTATYTVRERLFGLGTIGFATAGTAGFEATWRMVAKPLEVHQIVVQAINRYR